MRTVKEVSELTGVSIRTLQYYDSIGLLQPTSRSEGGYRLYDDDALEQLQQILLFRELEFPLKEIKALMQRPDFDRSQVLGEQIELLRLKREHLDNLIRFATGIKLIGVRTLDFSVFQKGKLDEYSRQAKANWAQTPAFQECAERSANRTPEEERSLAAQVMAIFASFGKLRALSPAAPEVQALVQEWHEFISAHFYQCSKEMLLCLGKLYNGGGDFTASIDAAGGEGTAAFVERAIEVYCSKE